ncbi:sigma-54 dependent transcriptional regulator [Methylovulum sp.]|uniref:sigma-54 interaction domain-containing protein n=1 Tax=Methylovulum sp. TaxID=1916980 RepID=UPI002601F2F1|nr:sigma-54 dependent transcriptional regulator [Methylovulum sp.]
MTVNVTSKDMFLLMRLLAFPNPSEMALSIRASALVFEDPKSKELLDRIKRIAPSELNALIIGETGTGKELAARHLHELSAKRNGPFLAVNCCALSETLIESELFGHEKGAFTGAMTAKQGWFEAASGGTLFLDEIGDLPQSMQVKLLRVLQEREVVRVGSHKAIPIDVRLIAATNVKLEEAVMAGRFREDLYYRLNVAALNLLPLRQRTGDILPLAEHFLKVYGQRFGCPEATIAPAAKQILLAHTWPGNIRELENVIHHALLVTRDLIIKPTDLNFSQLPGFPKSADSDAGDFEKLVSAFQALCEQEYPDLYARAEQALLQVAYKHTYRNQLATARLLGLSRHVVRARLIQHHILTAGEPETDKSHPVLPQGVSGPPILVRDFFPKDNDYKEPFLAEASQECWGF